MWDTEQLRVTSTSLCRSVSQYLMFMCCYRSGRDGVIAVWDTEQLRVTRTIPVFIDLFHSI